MGLCERKILMAGVRTKPRTEPGSIVFQELNFIRRQARNY